MSAARSAVGSTGACKCCQSPESPTESSTERSTRPCASSSRARIRAESSMSSSTLPRLAVGIATVSSIESSESPVVRSTTEAETRAPDAASSPSASVPAANDAPRTSAACRGARLARARRPLGAGIGAAAWLTRPCSVRSCCAGSLADRSRVTRSDLPDSAGGTADAGVTRSPLALPDPSRVHPPASRRTRRRTRRCCARSGCT